MMTLAEYKAKLLAQIEQFAEFYEQGNRMSVDEFPGVLNHAEWDEQFRIWRDMQDA